MAALTESDVLTGFVDFFLGVLASLGDHELTRPQLGSHIDVTVGWNSQV